MYIIAIGWLYITVLMAATEKSIVAGFLTLTFYGLIPVAIFLWVFGTPGQLRKRREAARERLAQNAVDDVVGQDDGKDAKGDQ